MLRTEAQQKKLCSGSFMAKTANVIGDSCTLLIIRDLLTGPKRFGEFETSLSGISTRTLTNKLKLLEKTGILKREDIPGKPAGVLYSLTKKGIGLKNLAHEMEKYGKKYL